MQMTSLVLSGLGVFPNDQPTTIQFMIAVSKVQCLDLPRSPKLVKDGTTGLDEMSSFDGAKYTLINFANEH